MGKKKGLTCKIMPYKVPGFAVLFADFNTGNWRDFYAYFIEMDNYEIEWIREFTRRAEVLYRRCWDNLKSAT